MKYVVTQERDEGLKLLRIRLIELLILTLTAVFVLLSVSKIMALLIPSFVFALDILLIVAVLLWGANKNPETHDIDNMKVEMRRISYQLSRLEYLAFLLYLLGIALLCFVVAKHYWWSHIT